eukprot:jgi/Psemu1/323294/estExt_fgenesh1_pg.C_650034
MFNVYGMSLSVCPPRFFGFLTPKRGRLGVRAMFERYITDVVTSKFGHILENVDSDKMRLSAWNGELTLEDVAIKTAALDTILGGPENSPVEIAYGHIGAFYVKIPWSLLSGLMSGSSRADDGTADATNAASAISVVLTDVDILITPRRKIVLVTKDNDDENEQQTEILGDECDADTESTGTSALSLDARRARKERKVQGLLDADLLKRVTKSSILAAEAQEDEKGSWASWVREKLTELLSNLSITVKNIHIRYEDPGTSMGFEWRVVQHADERTNDQEQSDNNHTLGQRYSNLSLNLDTLNHFRLSRQKSIENIGSKRGNLRPQRFRPAFSVGITLKEFSVQSTAGTKKTLEGPGGDDISKNSVAETVDDTTTSAVSASTPKATQPGFSNTTGKNFAVRRQHKRAAAKDLAIYWDSTTTLMCLQSVRKSQLHHDETKESGEVDEKQLRIKKEIFVFYKSCFAALNEGPSSSRIELSKIISTKMIRSTHSYLLDPVSPSVDLTLISNLATKRAEPQGTENSSTAYESDDDLSEAPRRSEGENTHSSQSPNIYASADSKFSIPPSSIRIELPPCAFTLSRNTLEDTVYLRKSLSVWMDSRKTIVSESALRRILKLRPSKPATKDPVGWWKYAIEATKVMTQASLTSDVKEGLEDDHELGYQTTDSRNDQPQGKSRLERRMSPFTRRKGWVGLVQALSRRRKYVKLYKILLELPVSLTNRGNGDDEIRKTEQDKAHQNLLQMEDQLLAREVAAFRIHTYEVMKKEEELDRDGEDKSPSTASKLLLNDAAGDRNTEHSTGGWSAWITRGRTPSSDYTDTIREMSTEKDSSNIEIEKLAMTKGETDDEIMSIEHRRWMMNEMKQALDREHENIQTKNEKGSNKSTTMTKSVVLTGDMPTEEFNPVVWTASLHCRKFAVQINDQQAGSSSFRQYRNATPLIRMSSAWVQNQSWNHDGSWNVDISLASMEVKDLISARGKRTNTRHVSTLMGSKSRKLGERSNEFLLFDGIRYHRNMSVTINRKLHWSVPNLHEEATTDRGSTTTVKIQVLPMEIVYSALPIEAVKRVFLAVKTPEIVDDYHKVLGVAKSWRNKQKNNLLNTLAHKNKRIVVDIDIAAPELLVPEDVYRPDSQMLAINLGRFQAFNDDESLGNTRSKGFDDQWRVLVSNVQVQSTSMASYRSRDAPGSLNEQLVEAFSIDFVLATKFVSGDNQDDNKESRISVSATLPRLAFNISSSTIRLISRLQQNFSMRQGEIQNEATLYDASDGLHHYSNIKKYDQPTEDTDGKPMPEKSDDTSRIFKFDFSAPAITLKLENDVDGRNSTSTNACLSTPIIDLSLRSIRGSLLQELKCNGDSVTKFDASLQSLGVIDLYQSAGRDFVLLMSSVPQNQLLDEIKTGTGYSWDLLHANSGDEVPEIQKDLVTVEYSSNVLSDIDSENDDGIDTDQDEKLGNDPDNISLWFHELYIEWNPDTLAAIHLAMRTTSIEEKDRKMSDPDILSESLSQEDESSIEDEFFDALEEEIHGVSDIDSVRALSEISTSTDSLAALGTSWSDASPHHQIGSPICTSSFSPTFGGQLSDHGRISISPFRIGQFQSARMNESTFFDALAAPKPKTETDTVDNKKRSRQKEIIFKLSKLRVSFNKETRHRKVFVAQMDRTFVSYSTRISGGSKIKMNLGNLVFIDPAHEENGTLYGQILGLQTKSKDVEKNSFSSLLEMEIIMNPKVRTFSSLLEGDRSDTVTIDKEGGKMIGSNCCVTAKLSPMRFVLIEQLWMEMMDYFFDGIIGTEVLGGTTDESTPENPLDSIGLNQMDSSYTIGSDAEGISFTLFDVSLDSPVILFPVTYSSPEYLRMKLSSVRLRNEYDGTIITDKTFGVDGALRDRMQWFNNCKISLDGLRLYSWSGRELSQTPVVASVSLRWPTGPLAPLIVPKWNVDCRFDCLDISLCRSDYSLLQNILSYNIGEPSRYMDEWTALQNLPSDALDELMRKSIVHFGYDKKNVAPTTYDVGLFIPSFRASFLENDAPTSLPLAVARCFDLKWQMRKESDLIVKQRVTCGIDLVRPMREKSGFETLMTISKDNIDFDGERERDDDSCVQPDFIYSSTSVPNGDNVRTIEIFDPCIYLIVPAWTRFVAFFDSLSVPVFLNEKEIGASIQVGDRWYRIGDDGNDASLKKIPSGIGNVGQETFSWITSEPISSGISRKPSLLQHPPTRQIKLLLIWPRIILSSVTTDDHPTRVILRMNHLDFLQTDNERDFKKTKSCFLHDVEVYTSSQKSSTHSISNNEENNSLIRPWSLSFVTATCNGESIGDCQDHTYKLSCDVLRARAAYSDMSIAIDVFLSVLHSTREKRHDVTNDLRQHPILSSSSFDSREALSTKPKDFHGMDDDDGDNGNGNDNGNDELNLYCTKPSSTIYDIQCDGFELKIADDSGRHFIGYQDLVIFSMGRTLFSRHESKTGTISMKLWLDCLDLFDCLQPISSPFRTAASSHLGVMGIRTTIDDKGDVIEPNTTNVRTCVPRKMLWNDFGTKYDGERYFEISSSFLTRMRETSQQCSHYLWGEGGEGPTPGLIEIACKFTENSYQEYDVRFNNFAVQWNPSTIIAMQRFLGRLRKESKMIAVQVIDSQLDNMINESEKTQDSQKDVASDNSGDNPVIKANIQIDSLTVCMNKEHQQRRLLALTLSSCNLVMHSSEQGMTIEGQIGDLSAFDNDKYNVSGLNEDFINNENRKVLSVLTDHDEQNPEKFLHIQYRTFTNKATSALKADVPEWIKCNLPSTDDIDDFLSLKVAATRFTYLKERTDELLDYLSNGLPGKGMGATSRAAKGFISRRIQTRSFLQLQVDSPQIFVPQHEMAVQGLGLKLGDVNVQSWFEEALCDAPKSGDSEWWRILSLKLSGFSYGMIREGSSFESLSSATNPIDLDILLRKPTIKGRTLSIRGTMSCFEVLLHYQDYALLRAVANDNIGRHVNTDKWDNVEKAYWMEEQNDHNMKDARGPTKPDREMKNKVAYSSNARFVRYGKSGRKGKKQTHPTSDKSNLSEPEHASTNTLEMRFDLAGVALRLRRNDLPEGIIEEDDIAEAFHYDVILLRVGAVEVQATANAAGDFSFNLSLFRIGLFDLGDSGRLIRKRYYHSLPSKDKLGGRRKKKAIRQPCPFVVLAEGYVPADDDAVALEDSERNGPEFVISVDKCPASSTNGFQPLSETRLPPDTKVTVAKVVINYLSFNAIARPFRETADFLSCAWPTSLETLQCQGVNEIETPIAQKKQDLDADVKHDSSQGFELKVVANYPRVFFLADESDLHSRALVLKGLAVVNVSNVNKKEVYAGRFSDSIDVQQITSVGAQLHGLETYINPDVSAALRFSERHSEMVGAHYSSMFNTAYDDTIEEVPDTLGVALIQPVTIGIECMQIKRGLFPTRRSLQVNIDPVSTMLSFEDLQLVEVVLKRWSSDRTKIPNDVNNSQDLSPDPDKNIEQESTREEIIQFEVLFETTRLGLGLRTEGTHVVVNSIQNSQYADEINHGDVLVSVGSESVQSKTLDQVVNILAGSGRPVAVGFERTVSRIESEEMLENAALDEESSPKEYGDEDSDSRFFISCYTLHFRSGMQLGLVFEKSACGQFPVVSKMSSTINETVVLSGSVDESDSQHIEVVDSIFNSEHQRLPRIGAVVVAIDDIPVEERGVEESWKMLSRIQDADSLEMMTANETTLSLTFQETHSSTWGNIDSIEVSSAGMALSFIDDLNGRDMPLFRGKLSSVQVHIERGLGINAHILDNTIPSLLTPLFSASDDENPDMIISMDQVRDIQTESIVSFSAISICSLDYFRSRVSFWEPLLEPSQLFFHFEKQDGSIQANRPAQIALEISDRLLRNQFTRASFTQNNHFGEAHMVSVNVTDAAAEVLVEASTRWKDWRKRLLLESGEDNFEYPDGLALEDGHHSSENIPLTTHSVAGAKVTEDDQHQLTKRAAAKKAAQGALNFAQKRGAETSKKSDSSKPFIFRNRTGISIAFVQQGHGLRSRGNFWKGMRQQSENSTIGEYAGLEEYQQEFITELADQEDAKFSMDLIDETFENDVGERRNARHFNNKIRSYEGRYPDLTVSIQAVAGVQVEPITNLQVFKVGSTIRILTVKKDSDSYTGLDSTKNSIQVVWNVEIEENRRILTLSTAVRVVSSGLCMPIEIGFQRDAIENFRPQSPASSIISIGIARSNCPFYMPLWLALKLEPVSIYVRPVPTSTVEYFWSESSVLNFGLFADDRLTKSGRGSGMNSAITGKWTWEETFSDLSCISCDSRVDGITSVWFSVFGTSSANRQEKLVDAQRREKLEDEVARHRNQFEAHEVLSVTLDSGLTIRNMLPSMIDLEVIQGIEPITPSDSGQNNGPSRFSFNEVEPDVLKFETLKSGECSEVFEVNHTATVPKLRIKEQNQKGWSTWASLRLNETNSLDRDDGLVLPNERTVKQFLTPSQINVQIPGCYFGIPTTFGIRVEPKMTIADQYMGDVYGLEVIVYAELWIRNITSLPLSFGCPSYQIYEPEPADGTVESSSDDSIAKFTAEAALMELTSLFEVGDKGMVLNQKTGKEHFERSHVIERLPGQQCRELTEEVFEYVEIENSMVKRKWWASESYNGYHKQIFDVDDSGANWKWLDRRWTIDCSGGAKPSIGGWESCKNLYTGNESFGGRREFNPSERFRRRRFFRKRTGFPENYKTSAIELESEDGSSSKVHLSGYMGGIHAFHQPLKDSFSREQSNLKQQSRKDDVSKDTIQKGANDEKLKIAIRCGDGTWSIPAEISDSGTCYGVVSVLASRWPRLTRRHEDAPQPTFANNPAVKRNSYSMLNPTERCDFKHGCLHSDLYEFCYTVSDADGEWGEFSRAMEVFPRFLIRNDSKIVHMKVKQKGAPNSTCVTLKPGEASPFYWADFRLPKLVSVIPVDDSDFLSERFRWSGGFDLCNLGMTPVRIRTENTEVDTSDNGLVVSSIRVLVEVRPGTGGHGINVSLREEEPNGEGSLFRIENLSPFPIWLSQDGVLANPTASFRHINNSTSIADGDCLSPNSKTTFALDVPYRQGKYAHRKEATLSELLHVRVALAPLSSRAGIESVKVIGLATMGESIRLNPSKLPSKFTSNDRDIIQNIRVLGVIATDGPTRVLRFCLMVYSSSDLAFRNAMPDISYVTSTQNPNDEVLVRSNGRDYTTEIVNGLNEATRMALAGKIPSEIDAKRQALFADLESNIDVDGDQNDGGASDKIFSFRVEFSGFIFSLVDSAPSEIAVASLRNMNALARWNNLRSTDATLLLSIGWLQIDNHVPSAPFKVAVRPDTSRQQEEEGGSNSSPLLVVAVAFAPEHKSKILVLRSVTVAPRDLVIALDLAFLVRLQRFFFGLQDHLRNRQFDAQFGIQTSALEGSFAEQKKTIVFPNFVSPEKLLEQIASFSEKKKIYFQGLTILPTNIKLSVAPAKALTSEQASLEGKETAAIHTAVRKGDVLVGTKSSGPLGVRVGRKNRTALAVVRGVFKSIVVDALLRLNGASLNFHGVFLRNHIATSTQLSTYLAAHYLSSLKHNVPALLGSLSAIGNPLGLIRGIGDGVSDFVTEPMKGFKRALKELDPGYAVDGVARGTESLARHTVGGIADSASLLMETFSKYMAVVTLDRRYAQKRDRRKSLRMKSDSKVTLVGGVESGFLHLVQGFREGVTGVVKAPIRGAEKRGLEGFAKGLGKGLLGLLVKPIIGITDAATDVMIGVKSTVEYQEVQKKNLALLRNQFRPRRPMYGRDKVLRPYSMEDAAAATLMLKTRCAGENYLSHLDMKDRVALLSVKRLIILGPKGEEQLALKYKHVERLEVRSILQEDGVTDGWGIIVILNTPRRNGSDLEVITCRTEQEAMELCVLIQRGVDLIALDSIQEI